MKSNIDLLSPAPRQRLSLILICLGGLIALVCLLFQTFDDYRTNEKISEQSDRLNAVAASRPVTKVNRQQQEEQKRWALLQAERNFSWVPLLAAIEKASDKNIELLEFHPDKSSRLILLRGESNSQKALISFIEKLENQEILKNVHLTHQEHILRERLETVGFEIKAFLK